jgi:hypothetical protein
MGSQLTSNSLERVLVRPGKAWGILVVVAQRVQVKASYVWLINPKTRQTWVYTGAGISETRDGVLTTDNPAIRIVLSELA